MTGREYTCAECGREFTSDWTDAEAVAEAVELFGAAVLDDPVVICDDCFQEMNASVPMALWAALDGGAS